MKGGIAVCGTLLVASSVAWGASNPADNVTTYEGALLRPIVTIREDRTKPIDGRLGAGQGGPQQEQEQQDFGSRSHLSLRHRQIRTMEYCQFHAINRWFGGYNIPPKSIWIVLIYRSFRCPDMTY